jgi:DNA polymerase/3'-5' exonuclease PolX
MEHAHALVIAEQARAALAPSCHRIEIAGSIRRRRPQVKDIELVAIPKQVATGLFGDEWVTDPDFCAVVNQWPAIKGQPTGKYTQRWLPEGITLDLFMADAENWGSSLRCAPAVRPFRIRCSPAAGSSWAIPPSRDASTATA